MSHRNIILTTILLLVISFMSLSFVEWRAMDPDTDKNWWVLAFADPHGSKTDFIIENHSDSTRFSYEILADSTKVQDSTVEISKGETKTISTNHEVTDQKITIIVQTSEGDKKEIYK
jgi:hypothetical protein